MDPVTAAIVVKPALQITSRLLKPLIDKVGKIVSNKSQLICHNFFNAYTAYLTNSFERHSYFTSVVFKNEQKKLDDYYLPLTIVKHPTNEQAQITQYPKGIFETIKKILIVDTAGMGKTTLLKYLFLCCVREESGIPIYIELRKLSKKISILDFILEQLSDINGKCSEDLLFQLLETGEFVFFLDGYDEIPENERMAVTSELQKFIEKASRNKYVLTSREETGLISFPQFQRYTIRPLQKYEAYTLLRKYGDNSLSETLIQKLEQPENAAIHEFLTNPLLTSLLYKSFEYKHIVPLKRHIFYRQVFEALYECHDLTKEGGEYQRTKRSGLDIDRFERVMRALGVLSYRKDKIEFSKEELLDFINEAKKLASEGKVISSDILHDLTHAVPLMVEDGNYIRWSHRSIQEYFAAQYICRDRQGDSKKILLKFFQKDDFLRHINLITLCADIDRPAFKQSIAKEIAETLSNEFNSIYQNKFENLTPKSIVYRKELCVGKTYFFIRVNLPKPFDINSENSHEVIEKELKPIRIEIEKQVNVLRGFSFGLANPAIALINNRLYQYIESLYQRTELPFIERITQTLVVKIDLIDPKITVQIINDEITNPLNTPNNFYFVNELLQAVGGWKFNNTIAKDFLESIEAESRVKDNLSDW